MSGGPAILIAEDEPLIAMMLEDFLDSSGYTVAASAETVSDAIAHAERGGFDAAILDVNLRGERIWPVADRLAAAGIPFLIATGGHLDPAPPAHADAPQLAKPYTLDTVTAALARIVPDAAGAA